MATPGDNITLSVSTIVADVGALTAQINHPMIAMQLVPAILPLPFAHERKTQFVRDALRGAVGGAGEKLHAPPGFFKPAPSPTPPPRRACKGPVLEPPKRWPSRSR